MVICFHVTLERLLLNHANTPGFLALGGEEFNPGPETRLDPGDLSDPGIEPTSLMSPTLVGRFFTNSATWEASI